MFRLEQAIIRPVTRISKRKISTISKCEILLAVQIFLFNVIVTGLLGRLVGAETCSLFYLVLFVVYGYLEKGIYL